MAVTAYGKLFRRVTALRLSHPTLYTVYNNRAGAYLKLGLFDEALQDAERGRSLAQESFKRCAMPGNQGFDGSRFKEAGQRACAGSFHSLRPATES